MSHVTRDNLEDLFGLSPIQEGIFFHCLLEPELSPYVEQGLWNVEGDFDLQVFRRAWDCLVTRHPVLRTVFRQSRRKPVQMVLRRLPVPLTVVDLGALPPTAQPAEIAGYLDADLRRPLDLAQGPLLRLALFHLAPRRVKMLWTFTHIIVDGWSLQLFLADLYAVYEALAHGREPSPACFPPFKEFILWLERQDKSEALAHWRWQLAGLRTPIPLPLDRNPATPGSRTHAAICVSLPPPDLAALEHLARELGATLSTLLQGAWALLLGRYGGEHDVVFGLTVSGRPVDLAGAERMLGPFINTLPMRAILSADTLLRDLIHSLQQQAINLNHFSHVSLTEVQSVSAVRPPRRLFESVFNFERRSERQFASGTSWRLEAALDAGGAARTNYDLLVDAVVGDGLLLRFSYVQELFEAATIARMAAQLATLLGSMPRGTEARVCDLESLPEAERRQLFELGGGHAERPFDHPAHHAVSRCARSRPEAVAASCDEVSLTYRELEAGANRLAHVLRSRGVGRESRVGLCGERGPGMLVGMLAVLKAGAAFVPLDPQHPDARLAGVLAGAGLTWILTGESFAARLARLAAAASADTGARPGLLCWDDPARFAGEPESDPGCDVASEDLAYVLYTSGSTGIPKGAMVTHGGMLNHLRSKIELCALDERSVVVQNASHCFDISVWQMLAPLLAGGRVAIYRDEKALDPEALLRAVAADEVTVLETVPTLLAELLEALPPARAGRGPDRLAIVLSTGETLPVPLARRFVERLPEVLLANVYGPTECADDITHYVLPAAPAGDAGRIPVGRPIPGMRIHVLGEHCGLAPIGGMGQIAAAGAGVGRGYLGNPAKTAEVFVPDPFSDLPGGRLYLTGDRGRWTAAGELEFLGRIDNQVKVRGQRIELGEVEAALSRHPAVRQAAAAVRPDRGGQPRLLAYWVGAEPVEPGQMRRFLAELLPAPMLPEALVQLPALPLLHSGKVDREALPEPGESAFPGIRVAPRNQLEARIAAVWREILDIEEVGVHDNFFELGGNSLKTLGVRAHLQHELGTEVPLRAIFSHPTVAEQALALAPSAAGPDENHGRIPRLSDAPHFQLSHAQQRLWFLYCADPTGTFYNLPITLLLEGPIDKAAFARAFQALVRRHESLRTRFFATEGEPRQQILPEPDLALPTCDLARLASPAQERQLARCVAIVAQEPFCLDTPPRRACLFCLSPERHAFLLVLHHIVTDGQSGQILVEDLIRLYAGECRQEGAAALPPLPIRYVDYAAWQAERIARGALEVEERYWLECLAGELPVLPLGADRAGVAAAPSVASYVEVSRVKGELAGRLRRLAAEGEATEFMAQVAMFAGFLHRVTGEEDLLIGVPTTGRDHPQAERVVGFFVNTLVLRQRLSGDDSFRFLLRRVKQTVTGALAHGEYPFDLLVQRLNPVRELDRTPLFQTFFATAPAEAAPAASDLRFGSAADLLSRSSERWRTFDLLPGIGLMVVCAATLSEGLEWSFLFSAERFDRATARRLSGHFAALLEEVAASPQAPLSHLTLLSPAERQQIRLEWNDTACEEPEAESEAAPAHALFRRQAELTPEAVAVVCRAEEVSFGELDARSSALARRLRRQGVGAEVLVAICARRSIDMIVGLLAILKAGGAYLPLDPELPRQRLALLLADSRPALLLVDRHVQALHPDLGSGRLCLELSEGDGLDGGFDPGQDPGPEITAENLAYVIYTSGSTGAPKAVAVTHRGLTNLVHWAAQAFSAAELRGVLASTSVGFDISAFELFAPLCLGGTVVLVESAFDATAPEVGRKLTLVNTVPSIMAELLGTGALPPGVRTVNLAGEALRGELVRRLYGSRTVERVENLYGPSEATVYATGSPVPREDSREPAIGRPLRNVESYVLERHGQPVPVGAVGELYLGGAGLARGYLNSPAATAERFVPHPFAALPGLRLYRTGDRARHRPDGELEFLGRGDDQLKVRGVRVEPAEIEAALGGHPAVREAVVALREGGQTRERILVAYLVASLVASGTPVPEAAELRAFLADRLPRQVLPAAFLWLARLPRTSSGKLDRRALPEPPGAALATAQFLAPRDALELAVSELWEEHLGRGMVGVRDNFFDLGGHSLQALSLLASLRSRFGADLPLRDFFASPTVEGVGRLLRQSRPAGAWPPAAGLIPLRASRSPLPPLFLVHPHGGSVFCYHALSRALNGERAIYGLQARGLEEGEEPLARIEDIAEYGCGLIRQVQPAGPYHLMGWSFGGPVAFEMARQLEARQERIAFLGILDTMLPAGAPGNEPDVSYRALSRAFFGTAAGDFADGDEDQALRGFHAAAQQAGVLPHGFDEPVLRRLVGVLRANTLALARYRPGGRIRADVSLFQALAESHVTEPARWTEWTQGRIVIEEVAGTHHTLVFPPAVAGLALAIERLLGEADAAAIL